MSAVVVHSVGATVIFVCPRRRYGVTYEEKRGRIFKGLTSYELPHFHLLPPPTNSRRIYACHRVCHRRSFYPPSIPCLSKKFLLIFQTILTLHHVIYIYILFFRGPISYPLDKKAKRILTLLHKMHIYIYINDKYCIRSMLLTIGGNSSER